MRAFAVSFSRFARKQIHVRCVWEIVKRRIVYYATPMYLWRTREARTFSAFFSAFDRLSFLSFSRDNKRYAKEYKYHTSDRWTKVRKRRIDEYRAIFEFLFSFSLFLSFFLFFVNSMHASVLYGRPRRSTGGKLGGRSIKGYGWPL